MFTKPVSILIIESQPLMRAALTETLSAEGFSVFGAVWDSQTMQTALKLQPSLILLSVGTSSWDDLKSISSLRQMLPSALIVALITGEIPGQEQDALNQGAHLVVKKTVSSITLLNILNQFLKKTEPAKMLAEL